MAELIRKKLPASTLIEVLISMVIIMIVFTIAIGIYANIITSGFSLTSQNVQQEIRKIISESKENRDIEDNTISVDSINYTKTVTPYASYSDLLVIWVKAEKGGRNLGTGQEIIRSSMNK